MPPWKTAPLERESLADGLSHGGRYRLEVLAGADVGKGALLEAGAVLSLGSDPESGLALTDPTVSWRHAELSVSEDGLDVLDLQSTNGVFVSGVRSARFLVRDEGTFVVGKTLLHAAYETAKAPLSSASFGLAVGGAPAMRALFETLRRVSASTEPLLLQGETGTGKELLASAVHANSPRGNGPFVVLDCRAMSVELIESELFGHELGAFTGAMEPRAGAFERADGGTLYFDGVDDLPLEVQPKLLRVLETGTVQRVGGNETRTLDVRVIASTRRDLRQASSEGMFREDLYFRLAVLPVFVPPLRERREDLPLLIRVFVASHGRPDFELSASLQDRLLLHPWPGNVRELRNVVERALAGVGIELTPAKVPAGATPPPIGALAQMPFKEAKEQFVDAFAAEYFTALFESCDRNISKMARIAGIARPYAHKMVNKYGLREKEEGGERPT